MNDRAVVLLEQYEIEVFRTRKGRGAILCDTNQGCLIFKEYAGNENKITLQNKLLQNIQAQNQVQVEQIIPTKENALLVKDIDGTSYVLKTYVEGRECNIYDRDECKEVMGLLAKLHDGMILSEDTEKLSNVYSPSKEYEKHNRELKRVRKYLKKRDQKTQFEIQLTNTFDYFLEQALTISEEWNQYSSLKESNPYIFCHGDYQYHNILFGNKGWYIMNFEKCIADDPIRDIYLMLRKLSEKSSWDVAFGKALLEGYERVRPISALSRIDLYYRLAYPEKFWKIVNFYYNSGKAWIPEKNSEKLETVILQEKQKQHFLEEVFQKVE